MRKHHLTLRKKWSTASVPSRMELVLSLLEQVLSCFAMATPTISANENTTSNKATSNETTTALAQPLTDTAVNSGKNESDISSPKNANAS